MPNILSHGKVIDDHWILLSDEDAIPAQGDIIVPLSTWAAQREVLLAREGAVSVLLDGQDEVETIADDLAHFAMIAIHFAKFVDGRGFSSALLLRDRYHYQGNIRAIGHIIRDQLFLMKRCGFSEFSFSAEIDLHAAAESLNVFSDSYQTAADTAEPLFRRRRLA